MVKAFKLWKPGAREAAIEQRLARMEQILVLVARVQNVSLANEAHMTAELDRTVASVQKLTDAADGMEQLLTTLAGEIRNSGTDAAALTALADKVDAKAAEYAAAVVANTPAAPPADGSGTTTGATS